MSPQFRAFGESWLRHNPGWELWEWGESDLGWLDNQDLYDRAAELCPERYIRRFQSNLARYEIIHQHGGLYVDCDSEALAPIEPLLDGLEAFAAEERPGVVANGLIGGIPQHPFWRKVIDAAPGRVAKFSGDRSPKSTGPWLVTQIHVENPGMLSLLPSEKIYPYHWSELVDGRPPAITNGAVTHHVWNALRGSVSVIVPWRDDRSTYRRRAWKWLRNRFADRYPEWQVVAASDGLEGPFSRNRAIHNAIPDTYGDIVVVSDADCWAPDLEDTVEMVRQGEPWATPSDWVHRLTASETRRVLAGEEPDPTMDTYEVPYRNVPAGGIVVMSRETLLSVPPDPRFVGWGSEDQAWTLALTTLVGPPWSAGGICYAFFHKPQERLSRVLGSFESDALLQRYRDLRGQSGRMRRLVEESQTAHLVDH